MFGLPSWKPEGDLAASKCYHCQRTKGVVSYIYSRGQRTQLKLGPVHPGLQILMAKEFKEPYPDGLTETTLVCRDCDSVDRWPRNLKPKRKLL